MLLTISTTHKPAMNLGYLFHKHPDKFQTFEFPYGKIHVFYSEASEEKCTICLLLDINPIELLRSKKSTKDFVLKQYVNDRPYVASSLMSAAISKVFSSAMNGKCDAFPELVNTKIPLEACLSVLPARGEENLIQKIFEPLGYEVIVTRHILDEKFPEWGQSDYYTAILKSETTLQQLLRHIYVLIPVLDDEKHYWVGEAEIEKLIAKGENWLSQHPEKDLIANRYLRHQKYLSSLALERLLQEESVEEEQTEIRSDYLQQVVHELKVAQAKTVLDLGCGTGKLLELLLDEKQFEKIIGADISHRLLEITKKRLYMDDMAPRQRERIELIHSSLCYNDKRLYGFDAAVIVRVFEKLDHLRIHTFEKIIFEFAQPRTIIITQQEDTETNKINVNFSEWCHQVAEKNGYAVRFKSIKQSEFSEYMGVFTLKWK